MKRWLVVAAAALVACVSSGAAQAALIHIGASGYLNASTPTTAISAPKSIVGFSFDTAGPVSGLDTNITSFSYTLNSHPVAPSISSVLFAPGEFTLNFVGGASLNLYSFGASFDDFAPGGYLASLGINGGNPIGGGLVVAAVSSVPLPASLPLFGAGLLALGAFGFMGRRRTGTRLCPIAA